MRSRAHPWFRIPLDNRPQVEFDALLEAGLAGNGTVLLTINERAFPFAPPPDEYVRSNGHGIIRLTVAAERIKANSFVRIDEAGHAALISSASHVVAGGLSTQAGAIRSSMCWCARAIRIHSFHSSDVA